MVQFIRRFERSDDLVHYRVHLRPRWRVAKNRCQNSVGHQATVKNSAAVAVVEEPETQPNSSLDSDCQKLAVEFAQPDHLSGY